MIPSRMRREKDIHISCGEMLKVQPRTIVHTRVQKGENEESVGSSNDAVPLQGKEASSFHITLCDETPIEVENAEEAPHELEEGMHEEIYVALLKKYIDVFAWTYKEMPGLDPKVVVHCLAVKKSCRPVKQAQRRFRPELIPSIEGEVNKLIEAGFIREVKYPTWISSIVPVRKKNGQIRICVDFRDLNVACPKDDFPLPITELMIDVSRRLHDQAFEASTYSGLCATERVKAEGRWLSGLWTEVRWLAAGGGWRLALRLARNRGADVRWLAASRLAE
nr:uncharacterized protein LOC109192688 [Ipomoea batatas]